MIFFIDPIYIVTSIIGYIFVFLVASYIAPRFANKLSGKLSLYASMFLLAFSILFIFSIIILSVFYVVGYDLSNYIFSLIIFVLLINLITYIISPLLIDLTFSTERDEYLQKLVDEVKERVGIKGKIIALRAKGLPNAFAYGNFIFGRRVAVTESLINMLDEEELKAVIGHELGHHKHRDAVIMLLFGLIPSIIYFLGYSIIWNVLHDRNRNSGLILFGLLLVIASFLVQLLVLAFSRLREYYADYVGAKYVSKSGMQSSLAKLYLFYKRGYESEVRSSIFSTLFIYAFANPLVSKIDIEEIKNSPITELEFLSTHPPIQKRLKFIDQIA